MGITDNPRDARKTYNCELCRKEYAKQTELDAHEKGYDHQHTKRLKEMRHLTRGPPTKTSNSKKRGLDPDMMPAISTKPVKQKTGIENAQNGQIGFPSQMSDVQTSAAQSDVGEQKVVEERWIERPLHFDELDEVDEIFDLQTNRPLAIEQILDMQHRSMNRPDSFYENISRRTDELRDGITT